MYIRRLLLVISVFICFVLVMKSYNVDNILYRYLLELKKDEEKLFTLYIPRINLEEIVYNMNSSKNDVDYNIEILKGSNIDDNFLFLAAHSGRGSASYFNRLVELEIGDIILIDDGYDKDYFVVEEKFYIVKNGYFEYSYFNFKNRLYLITCSLENNNYQLIVESKLVD